MPVKKLREFLNSKHVKYVTISHSPAYTMSEIAALAHVPGKTVAKTVMVKIDDRMAMAVVPSPSHVDLELLRDVTGADSLELADEKEFEVLFPDCEVGAMPPFGNLYDMDVFLAAELADQDEIVFNAGTHTELMKLPYRDYERLVRPKILAFSCP